MRGRRHRARGGRRPARSSARRRSRRARPRPDSTGRGSKRTCWQRERIVGSTSVETIGDQDQVNERRRLLERLEHAVGGLVAELVDALDHEHPARGLKRRPARRRDHRAVDVADEDLVRAARRDPGEVRMRAGERPRPGALGIGRARAQQRGRKFAGDRSLAGAARPMEQVRVRWAAARLERGPEQGPRASGGDQVRWARSDPNAPRWTAAIGASLTVRSASMTGRGRLITIEGIDGTGKTTLAQRLPDRARPSAGSPSTLLREPGGVEVSERIRALVADAALHVHPSTEALLYAAARAQLVEQEIAPDALAGSAGSCSTGSSTLRSPTRAAAANSGSNASGRSTVRHRRARPPTGRCCW